MNKPDYDKLQSVFYGNMTGGMYVWLGERLGVSGEVLQRLQIGFAPVVQFANRTSFDGWFTAPMRDENAKVIGFAMRSREDKKINYPGSKLGCIYEVNPKHIKGVNGYSAGPQNWVRTSPDLDCPICHKNDGCLVSHENPEDPKAVLCCRDQTGKFRSGSWLHIRKPEGDLTGASALAGEGDTLAVEGMSDVAAGMDLGFAAVGRPGNTQALAIFSNLVRGRSIICMGENDQKPDGKWPGHIGMISAFTTASKVSRKVVMLMPPGDPISGVKDLRTWKVVHQLTRQGLQEAIVHRGVSTLPDSTLANNNPDTVAHEFLNAPSTPMIRVWHDEYYRYGEGRYDRTPESHIEKALRSWAVGKMYLSKKNNGEETPEELVMHISTVSDIMHAVHSERLLPSISPPDWIDGPSTRTGDLVPFANGVLNATTDEWFEPDPNFFNLYSLPVSYDASATCPRWMQFLDEALSDDPTKIDCLQEWMGYFLTADTSQSKFLYVFGPTGTGKSRALRVIEAMNGSGFAPTSVSALSSRFGLQPLVGKSVVAIPDARLARNTDAIRFVERLLSISGGDAMTLDRKGLEEISIRPTFKFIVTSNEMLSLPDMAEALARRTMFLQFNRVPKVIDKNLDAKHIAELPGITNWAIQGLKRLRLNGGFTNVTSSGAVMEDWKDEINTCRQFLKQHCEFSFAHEISVMELQNAAQSLFGSQDWNRSQNRLVANVCEGSKALDQIVRKTSDKKALKGIRLTPDSTRAFIHRR